ncbi:MAG: hypothetical protein E7Z73_06460 [Methanobrevibacter millerae]|uniref:Adhesin-like protein n=1 Tax=Methanobrevibacter millerae TaxID=230361 RepID=A0A8T3VC94_9EURY|nr:hypothetical protein [Methanobrevibacter millerae]MBE6505367.1 hypothetical protein [Methanobrevibacter millerae]
MKKYILILIIIALILVGGILFVQNQGSQNNPIGTANNANAIREVIANNSDDPGSVEVIRNVGNPNGEKIAYVVGVHPLEHEVHETLVKILPETDNLNYSYDIYIINVTDDVGHYGAGYSDKDDKGRQNGQNLAYKYVYPKIVNGSYKAAIDVHSNIGAYPYKTFVFSPVNEGSGEKYASDVAGKCENITYYSPESTTSGPFLTIPLNEYGIPAFYFEEYSFANQSTKDIHVKELIKAVDGLKFK